MRNISYHLGFIPLSIFLLSLLFVSCDGEESVKRYRIGVSQCSGGSWRQKQNSEMLRELLLHEDVTMELLCAEDNEQKQMADIQHFIDEKVDILVVSPYDTESLTDMVTIAYQAGIPVLLFDRELKGDAYTAFVGGDNVGVGKLMAAYIVTRLQGRGGRVIELMGDRQTSPASLRHVGLTEGLKENEQIHLIASVDAGWLGPQAAHVTDSLLRIYGEVDVIVAHSDYMADEAKKVADRLLPGNQIIFVGADGFGASGIGIEAVEKGVLDATAIYPTGGDVIIQTALKILHGERVERCILLPSNLVSTPQEATLLISMDRVLSAEVTRVERMHDRALFYLKQSRLERMLLYTLFGILVLACSLCVTFYRLNRLRRASNKRLHEQQNKLRQQNEQLLAMTKELEEVTNAKLVFFTNISHDFRTPLTLIAAPVEEALSKLEQQPEECDEAVKRLLSIAQRNVRVLLDLVNQILDFRKVENGKMKLKLQRVNIYEQMRVWHESFISLAQKKGINLSLLVGDGEWIISVDVHKLERMVYNLMGNSIKFTPCGGSIILECANKGMLTISVRDSGPGIDKENLNNIFERFYQIDNNSSEGSGIGLALVKKYVELMGGKVVIESNTTADENGLTGTSITLYVPVSEETIGEVLAVPQLSPDNLVVCSELPSLRSEEYRQVTEDESLQVALVIDDNADMRSFISALLEGQYRVLLASDGEQGLQMAKESVPDIIICDVMMPVMDGLECCRQLKNELTTSHIPVVMLTACSLDEQWVKGLQCGAEAYLAKPFSSSVLKAQMETLLKNRCRVSFHSSNELNHIDVSAQETPFSSSSALQVEQKLSRYDRLFLEKMHDLVEKHYREQDFNVESLADMICLSRTQLYRKCKALTGDTPVELIRRTRLEHAREILMSGYDSVADVARAVGIPDSTYFSKCYKSYFGINPSEIGG